MINTQVIPQQNIKSLSLLAGRTVRLNLTKTGGIFFYKIARVTISV